jgi:hypothetical protein
MEDFLILRNWVIPVLGENKDASKREARKPKKNTPKLAPLSRKVKRPVAQIVTRPTSSS